MSAIRSILEYPYEDIPFPAVIDNSMISTFKKCEGAGYYSYLENLSPTGTNVHLHAGGAFAYGMEHTRRAFYVDGKPADEAIGIGVTKLLAYYGDYQCPPESAKSAGRMAEALDFYFEHYPLGTDYVEPWSDGDSTGIEFGFSFPLPVLHPTSGDPILYCGRFDLLGRHKRSGQAFVVDEKTATQLGTSWVNQWGLDSQFTGYCAGARIFGKPVVGAIIRGVSILKTKYDTKEAIIYRSDWEIERWYKQLIRDIQRMIVIWQRGREEVNWKWDKAACGAYGGCAFSILCASNQPDRWKPVNFEPRVWHPMIRDEHVKEVEALEKPAT